MSNIKVARSRFDDYCEGYAPSTEGKYVLALKIGVGVVEKGLSHQGSHKLDEINAFDKAEVDGANIGQINMVTVSSFCGPQGVIWGHDIASRDLVELQIPGAPEDIVVHDAAPLLEATEELLGTVEQPLHPILPGSHVLCAAKDIKKEGPCKIYSAIALAVPRDRDKAACLMMEDIGEVPPDSDITGEDLIKQKLVKSVLEIGQNQKVVYESVFVGMKAVEVRQGEIGCALVASPYLALPAHLAEQAEKELNSD